VDTPQTIEGRGRLGGPEGNELLTVATAAVLVALLLALGVTIIDMGGLVRPHMVLGMLLIPPVLLKLASTGYRFARYYGGSAPYRTKGPPRLALRLLAPLLVVATLVVFVTGVILLVDGHKVGGLLEIHKVSFIVWGVLFGVHFLAYLPLVARSLAGYRSEARSVPGAGLRATLVAAAIGAGAALAVVLIPTIDNWQA
jgi:hypothetical protein